MVLSPQCGRTQRGWILTSKRTSLIVLVICSESRQPTRNNVRVCQTYHIAGLSTQSRFALWTRVVVDLAGAHVCGWAGSMTPSIQYERVLQRDPRLNIAANNLAMLVVTYRTDKSSLDRPRSGRTDSRVREIPLLSIPGAGCPTNAPKIPMRLVPCRGPSTSPFSCPSSASGARDSARTSFEHALNPGATFAGRACPSTNSACLYHQLLHQQ